MNAFAIKAKQGYVSVCPDDELALDVNKNPLKLPHEMASFSEAQAVVDRYSDWFNCPPSIVRITKDIQVFQFLSCLGIVIDKKVDNWCVDFWGHAASMEATRLFDDERDFCRSELLMEAGLGMYWFYETGEGIVLRAAQSRTALSQLQLSVEIPCHLLLESTAKELERAFQD